MMLFPSLRMTSLLSFARLINGSQEKERRKEDNRKIRNGTNTEGLRKDCLTDQRVWEMKREGGNWAVVSYQWIWLKEGGGDGGCISFHSSHSSVSTAPFSPLPLKVLQRNEIEIQSIEEKRRKIEKRPMERQMIMKYSKGGKVEEWLDEKRERSE